MLAMRWPRRRSRWIMAGIGIAAIVVGASLTLRPFTSLDALTAFIAISLILVGAGDLAADRITPAMLRMRLIGLILIATGAMAFAWPGATIRAVAIITGLGMLFGGVTRIGVGLRPGVEDRYVLLVGGAAGVIFGLLALSWQDVTILAIALIVGPFVVIYGLGQLIRALGSPGWSVIRIVRGRSWLVRTFQVVRVTGSLVLAVALIGVSAWFHNGSPGIPSFYKTPKNLPSQPGQLLRSEAFDRALPDGSRAVLILYTTTALDGSIGVASAEVVIPTTAPPASGSFPVVLWTHGTTGVAQKCAPTLLPDPLASGAMPASQQAIDNGWVIVAPDYLGLGTKGPHPYLIGVPEAESSLDAVRAARQIDGLNLSAQTVVWGHSQGGGAALWVGIEAKTYAPDVPLAGVAAMAPATDLPSLATSMFSTPVGMLFGAYILDAYSEVYPDVSLNDYIRSSARDVVDAATSRCINEPATLLSVAAILPGDTIFSRTPDSGPLEARLAMNVPAQLSGVPTFVGQGAADDLILPGVQQKFVEGLCTKGAQIAYHTYAGKNHLTVVANDSPMIPDLLAWTTARFAGEPQAHGCSTTAN